MLDPNFKITEVPPTDIPISADPVKWEGINAVRKEIPPPAQPLPEWLTTYTPEEQRAIENGTLVKHPRTKAQVELEEQTFDTFFHSTFLDAVTIGDDWEMLIKNDPRSIDRARFMRWVMKDKNRQSQFEEAQEIATEFRFCRMGRIAEGSESLEDIERSKLRLKHEEFAVKSHNKRRYGAEKESPLPFGAGGITINIGAVESPYLTGNTIEQVVERLPNV